MKKTLMISYLALLSLVIAGCGRDNEAPGPYGPPVNEKSYIQGFFELNDLHVFPMSGFKANKENNSIKFAEDAGFDAPRVYEISNNVGISILIGSQGIGKGLIDWKKGGDSYVDYYNELVEKIGDTSYNSKLMYGFSSNGIVAVADTLQSVNITCNKQIDERHPAGSSLNDLFSVYFEDPYAVIKNGYKSLTGENYYSLEGIPEILKDFPYSIFGAKLSSVDLTTKPHIGTYWTLVLETAPETTGEYTFTVSITNKQGKTIERTAAPIKLKGLRDVSED
jgi:hypothetical protein